MSGDQQPQASDELTVDQKYELVRSVGEECISETELRNLLEKKPDIRCYDGFEPSGRMHIAQGLFKAINVNKCTKGGCTFIFWVADWFALMNDKMGGDLERIKAVGEYLMEVWTAAGMDMSHVEFKWSSDDINGHAAEYWKRTLDIGRRNTLARIKKCCQIMGRQEGTLTSAQILYPLMQCADIFYLKADVCQLGVDQRKVNMLAREYCDMIGKKLKPVVLSHHMLSGLLAGQAKMSKSNPESAIFMEDSPEDVARKINNAYCPRAVQTASEVPEDGSPTVSNEKNPVLDYIQYLIFSRPEAVFMAGGTEYKDYPLVEQDFLSEKLSEKDLKQGLIDAINVLLDPVRNHFETNEKARNLLEQIKEWRAAGLTTAAGNKASAPVVADSEGRAPHLVAWLPCLIKLPLNTAVKMMDIFANFEGQVSVVVPDWSAFVNNNLAGDDKGVDAVLQYNVALMKQIRTVPNVTFVKQSEFILKDPNTYWLTTIGVGRRLDLGIVENSSTVTSAGHVIGGLMRVADAVLLNATEVLDNGHDENSNELVVKYTEGLIKRSEAAAKTSPIPDLCDPKTKATGADDCLFCDDTDMDLGRKIKKAFCAPQDPVNGIVDIAQYVIATKGSISVKQPQDQGGDKDYTDGPSLVADFASGALHPGDLKPAVKEQVLALTKAVRDQLKTPEMKKLSTAVKTAEKKLAKAK